MASLLAFLDAPLVITFHVQYTCLSGDRGVEGNACEWPDKTKVHKLMFSLFGRGERSCDSE